MPPPSNENDNGGVQNAATTDIITHTLSDIDDKFTALGCLGHGRFGSVYLAEKKSTSKRKVALKVMRIDPTDEEEYETFTRELDAVVTLNDSSSEEENNDPRTQHIVFFEDWFVGPNFACIVMNYADGGTLSSFIQTKFERLLQFNNNNDSTEERRDIMKYLFSERRIAWYASQLCEALSYAHSRGVAHHDIKSSNVLINGSSGGKLLLADFGSALKPGEEAVGFTRSFAPPELLASHDLEDYSCLRPDKIDAFGLGCILYELVTCQRLTDNSGEDETLAQYIGQHGLDAALNHDACLKIPWLPEKYDAAAHLRAEAVPGDRQCGYSHALRCLIRTLLDPNPEVRWLPSQLQDAFRKDPHSPLLTPTVIAAQRAIPGDIITIDNVQLGMFVMRGPDWNDTENGNIDNFQGRSSIGSTGVVVELDPDALFCTVAFPDQSSSSTVAPTCFRTGSENKFELIAAPTPVEDFCSGNKDEKRWDGLVSCSPEMNIDSMVVGQKPNEFCQIVGVDNDRRLVLATPTQMGSLPPTQSFDRFVESSSFAGPQEPLSFPRQWRSSSGGNEVQILELPNDSEERINVVDQFHCIDEGGLDRTRFRVTSVKRLHNEALWKKYAGTREDIALENWGISNVERLFHGFPANDRSSLEILCLSNDFPDNNAIRNLKFCPSPSKVHQGHNRGSNDQRRSNRQSERQMFLSRVVLGRVYKSTQVPYAARSDDGLKYHSWIKVDTGDSDQNKYYTCTNLGGLYPEYIITYRKLASVSSRQSQGDLVSSISSLYIHRRQAAVSAGRNANNTAPRVVSNQSHNQISGPTVGASTASRRTTRQISGRSVASGSGQRPSRTTNRGVSNQTTSQSSGRADGAGSSQTAVSSRRVANNAARGASNQTQRQSFSGTLSAGSSRNLASSQRTAGTVPRSMFNRSPRQSSGRVGGAGTNSSQRLASTRALRQSSSRNTNSPASLVLETMATGSSATGASVSVPTATPRIKECVICMSKPVQRIFIPCGHPCLCDDCSTEQVLKRLRRRGGCPECRTPFTQTAKFYGKVLMDD